MRVLQIHAEFIEYEPIKKEIAIADEAKKEVKKYEDVLVLFTAIEEDDEENLLTQLVEEVKKFSQDFKISRIVVYPYAHLSNNLAEPAKAREMINKLAKLLEQEGFEVYKAPFGWMKRLHFNTKSHPMAEQLRVYGKEAKKVKKKRKNIRAILARLGKPPSFEKEKLSDYDHRIIGIKQDLFSFHEVAVGQPFIHKKGMIILNELMKFWRKLHEDYGYLEVRTPILYSKVLWEISGHLDYYKEFMFFTRMDDEEYALKPMNCPAHIIIYKSKKRSYKEMPIRICEFGLVHRHELSGVLSGLFRVRALTQDDAHIFVREDQIEEEISNVIELVHKIYSTFGFSYNVELSTRPEKYMGSLEIWNKAEEALKQALKKKGIKFSINEGEGAFYGPKIDFHIEDVHGRKWQCATIQLDFMLPERFKLSYVDKDGQEKRPVMIHRVIFGSLERFLGILTEHYKGAFPVWLSPVQAIIIPVSEKHFDYAREVYEALKSNNVRVELSLEGTVQKRIREAQIQKIPYMLVVGEQEKQNKTLAIRMRSGEVKKNVKLDEFLQEIKGAVAKKL